MKRIVFISVCFFMSFVLFAQSGGNNVYSFLELTNSARVAALGGNNVSISDGDLNLVFHNPALLSAGMDQHMNLNYINYFAGINYGYTSYAFQREGIGNFAAGVHYVDYGSFDRTDELGNYQGSFRASEYALNLVYSRSILDSLFSVGVNVKPVFSVLEQYTSMGILADVGIFYDHPESYTSAGLVIKNAGLQLFSYSGTREKLPFEIQAGFTQGLAHAPFRFSLLLQNLEQWDLTYVRKESNNDFFGNETEEEVPFAVFSDKLMRHVVVGVEFLLGDSFHLDFGYDYKRRQEMKMDSWPGMVGFSWGLGFRIKKFHVAYGRSTYHLAGGTNQFSLTTNLSEFYK